MRQNRLTAPPRPRRIGRLLTAAFFLATAILGPAGEASACACCAEHGDRFVSTDERTDWDNDILGAVGLSGTAQLYQTACGDECIVGIENPANTYALVFERDGDDWTLVFIGPRNGTIAFTLPRRMTQFAVDPTPDAARTMGALYREWRLTMAVRGTGAFAAGLAEPATATLILHGTGNACPDAGDFTNWTLDVDGPKADFRFFGTIGGG